MLINILGNFLRLLLISTLSGGNSGQEWDRCGNGWGECGQGLTCGEFIKCVHGVCSRVCTIAGEHKAWRDNNWETENQVPIQFLPSINILKINSGIFN